MSSIKQPFVNPKMMGEMIRQAIRSKLFQGNESTKAELAQITGISFPTVGKALDEMNAAGEVLLTGLGQSSGGRRPKTYKLNPDYMTGLAVYLEHSFSTYSLLNYEGEVIGQETLPGVMQAGPALLTEQIEAFLGRYPSIRALTLGIPGAVDNGRAFHIPSYERFTDFNFKTFYEERLPLRVEVENDMNATAMGYYDRYVNDDSHSVVYLYLGKNGPGAGVIVNGQVVRGRSSFSGEISFLPLSDTQSFMQLLEAALEVQEQDPTESRSRLVDAISRLIATFTAAINPHTFVFSRSELTGLDLGQIRARSAMYVPEQNLPAFVVSDWEQDYLHGLHRLTIKSMLEIDRSLASTGGSL
ncbi:ROK family protein [Paenibacillus sp. NPDC058071]|uniref:ROK family protein n=1 Tax=Paenibacillus sp. NPDC058071 TaxID=3346326 RepID=UPI0036DD4FED